MKILFDSGTPWPLRHALQEHTVRRTQQEGWASLDNGELLRAAESRGFDVLVTTDQQIRYQQNLKTRRVALVVLTHARWSAIQRMKPEILQAVNKATPGSYTEVEILH